MTRRTVTVAISALTVTAALAAAGPAQASFPGTNGLIAYTSGGNVFLVDPTLSPPVTQQITTIGGFTSVNWDATGKRLVADNTNPGIAGINFLEPRSETPVTPLPGTDTNDDTPAFDPTGTMITFEESNDIFVENVDGTGRTNMTLANGDVLTNPDWSPDGQFLAAEDSTDHQIKRITLADGTLTTLTPPAAGCAAANPCDDPSYSPDGQRVAYDQDAAPANGIYTVAADGSATTVTRLSDSNDDISAYAPEGTQVAFQDNTSRLGLVPTDGSLVKTSVGAFIVGRLSWGVEPAAPEPPPPPSNQFTFGALTLDKAKGTASQTVTVPGTGQLALAGSGIVPQRPTRKAKRAWRIAVTAGDVPVLIKAKGDKKKKLKRKGKVKVTASFTFTPDGGTANTLTKQITLKRTKKK
jgi:dipeptidyl aminopeptidase/acylaminoacyl peptidase